MISEASLASWRADNLLSAQLLGHDLSFATTWGLFSPKDIDEGTLLLLQYLQVNPSDNCLDLGCGYGPLGVAIAKSAPQGETVMLDKDFVAVDYANLNAQSNGAANAQALLSNGFSAVPAEPVYDLVVSNIPAKVGKEMLTIMLWDAMQRLKPGGAMYVVTINGLRQFMKRYMEEVFGDYKKLKQGKTYTVARAYRQN